MNTATAAVIAEALCIVHGIYVAIPARHLSALTR